MMVVLFYDNLEATPIDGLSCLVDVERVYGLDWGRFGEEQWRELSRIYGGLPGAVRHRDVPWWFGDDADVPPFLWASVEPTGLQVYGVLPEADWKAWDGRFRTAAVGCRAGCGNSPPATPGDLGDSPTGAEFEFLRGRCERSPTR